MKTVRQPAEVTQRADRVTWIRTWAACALLIGLTFIQNPGRRVADTKFDLVAGPESFLMRALHLWDDTGFFGQLQNQAYGYLWPMGPFFWAGSALDLPGWVIQRGWLALLLCVAFVGMVRLARAFGVTSDVACMLAGFAYATSPRILSLSGAISIEAWPSAVAPWVLLPLVIGAERGSPRRAALLSAVAVAMVGGVNAAATFAVIPLGALWLLTRTRGPRKTSMMLWWPLFTLMGTLWWLVPLFVMGQFSPPFLDFIESAATTTFPATVFDALRGTTAWVPYLDPRWQGGNFLITEGYLALNSAVLVILGLVGLAVRDNPHRQFLLLGLLLGLFLTTMGHQGSVSGWGSDSLRAVLDGVLAPVRNIHKFDPIVRVPLVLGLAWAVERALRAGAPTGERKHLNRGTPVAVLATIAVIGAATPITMTRMVATEAVLETPPYWAEAAAWLEHRDDAGGALLVPGTSFADYLWGAPQDEPLQYLGSRSRWAVRNAIPLTQPGMIRMLDAVEERLAEGRGSAGLTTYLERAGIRHLVVRHDLTPSWDVPDPALVHQALEQSPGIVHVSSFGPPVGSDQVTLDRAEGRLIANGGWGREHAAIEIFQVGDGASGARTAEELPVVVGGPEDLLDLVDVGLLDRQPTALAVTGGEPEPGGSVLLTDGYQLRERTFGHLHDASSPVRTKDDPRRTNNPEADYSLGSGTRWRTTARLQGVSEVSASGSRSDANALGGSRRGSRPLAAVDGDPTTAWTSNTLPTASPWWSVTFDAPVRPGSITLRLGEGAGPLSTVRVVTEHGVVAEARLEAGDVARVRMPGHEISWLRVEDAASRPQALSLAEVTIPGVDVMEELVLPSVPADWPAPASVLLSARSDARTGCVVVVDRVPCLESRVVEAEEPGDMNRVVALPRPRDYATELIARPRAGAALVDLLQTDDFFHVSSSSTGPADLRASALAASDGDIGTTWFAALDDVTPVFKARWLGKRKIRGVTLALDPRAPARRPQRILVTTAAGEQEVDLDASGHAEIKKVRTDTVAIRVLSSGHAAASNNRGDFESLPVGISELAIDGVPRLRQAPSTEVRDWGCGTGPTLVVNGVRQETALVASAAQLWQMEDVSTRLCSGAGSGAVRDRPDVAVLPLLDGENDVRVEATPTATAAHLVMKSGEEPVAAPTAASVDRPSVVERTFTVTKESGVLVAAQNFNAGWTARQGDDRLTSVMVDGWQQAWELDGTGAVVEATFAPDRGYRWGLLVGAVLFLGVLLLLLVPRRRWGGDAWQPLRDTRVPGPILATAGLLTGGLLGGWPGVVCMAAGGAGGWVLRRLVGVEGMWLAALVLFAPAMAYLIRPWGAAGGWAGDLAWVHYCALVVLGACFAFGPRAGERRARRAVGVSTRR